MGVNVAVAQLSPGLAIVALMTRTAPGACATEVIQSVWLSCQRHVGDEALIAGHLRDQVDVGPARAAIRGDVEEPAAGADRDAVQIGRADAEVVGARSETCAAGGKPGDVGAPSAEPMQDPAQAAVVASATRARS